MSNSVSPALQVKNPILRWILFHDDKLLFNVLYIGLALILSIALGLFWLVAVIGIHWIIELYRQLLLGRKFSAAVLETFWELKLDLSLIIFALWLGVYLDMIFGIAGLSAATRVTAQAGGRMAQTGTRVAIWQRVIRSVLISLDDVGLAMKALARRKDKVELSEEDGAQQNECGQKQEGFQQEEKCQVQEGEQKEVFPVEPGETSWSEKYTRGDWLSLAFGGVFLLLILLAPVITDMGVAEVLSSIREDLVPFP